MASPQESAHEQLRIIRNLMERATIYRSISAFTALIGGLLSLAACGVVYFIGVTWNPAEFLVLWGCVLALTGLASIASLWSGSLSRKEPFFSSGLRLALISLAPSVLLALALTLLFWLSSEPYTLVPIWIAVYGVALLSTQHFAPTSIIALGWSFVIAGIGLMLLRALNLMIISSGSGALDSSILMAATFGLFHLVYAAAVWLKGGDRFQALQEGADVRL